MALIHQLIAQAKPAYILVNNRSEGDAPKTIQGLVAQLQIPTVQELVTIIRHNISRETTEGTHPLAITG